jgi:cell division protein FtsW
MKKKPAYDLKLFCAVITLVALGLVMVFSASRVIASEQFSSPFFFFQKHAIRVALGLLCLYIFMKVPYGIYRRFNFWILAGALLMLASIFVWGRSARGAERWLNVFVFTIQPVEVAKYSLVIFLAARLAEGKKKLADLEKGFLPLIGASVAMALMVGLQPNISNAVLLTVLTMTLLFVGGCRIRHLGTFAASMVIASAPFLYRKEYIMQRITVLFNPEAFGTGIGWQTKQSMIAFGSGFIFGCGPGRGHQKYMFLPDAHTDFIYSIIGEEFGFIGTAVVLFLFGLVFRRALRISRRAPNEFGRFLALGIGLTIFATALINMAMTTGLLPTAGLPLPFVSYGGSSLVASMAAIGILLNISTQGRDPEQTAGRGRTRSMRNSDYARRATVPRAAGGRKR